MQSRAGNFLSIAILVVLYDALASATSRFLVIEYFYFSYGTIVAYLVVSFLLSLRFGFLWGLLAGVFAGLVDATAGLAVSNMIGPQTVLDYSRANFSDLVAVTVFATTLGLIVGLIGSGTASLLVRFGILKRKPPAAE